MCLQLWAQLRYDLSDLVDRLQWLISHDAEAKAIAQNGVAFAHRGLADSIAGQGLFHHRCTGHFGQGFPSNGGCFNRGA